MRAIGGQRRIHGLCLGRFAAERSQGLAGAIDPQQLPRVAARLGTVDECLILRDGKRRQICDFAREIDVIGDWHRVAANRPPARLEWLGEEPALPDEQY
jgi:hypothetical protein